MGKRASLEDRPQYISNPLHKQAVDVYLATRGPAARRRKAFERKFKSDCERLGLSFREHYGVLQQIASTQPRVAGAGSLIEFDDTYHPWDDVH